MLFTYGKFYFRHQPTDADAIDTPHQLVSATETMDYFFSLWRCFGSGTVKQTIDFALRNSMVATGGAHALDLSRVDPRVNPLPYCGLADSDLERCIAQMQQHFIFLVATTLALQQSSRRVVQISPATLEASALLSARSLGTQAGV